MAEAAQIVARCLKRSSDRESQVSSLLLGLLTLGALLVVAGVLVGSSGLLGLNDDNAALILWEIRLPRSLGAWCGALLGMAGALAQGLFRNPLADPYLLGSAGGAGLAVALTLALTGISLQAASMVGQLGLSAWPLWARCSAWL